jgi:hypothetical protein
MAKPKQAATGYEHEAQNQTQASDVRDETKHHDRIGAAEAAHRDLETKMTDWLNGMSDRVDALANVCKAHQDSTKNILNDFEARLSKMESSDVHDLAGKAGPHHVA